VIKAMPPNNAPGPDRFTVLFYQSSWLIIKHDVLQAFHALWALDFPSFYLVNQAYLILLRKKPDADCVQDFRPISLIHVLASLSPRHCRSGWHHS
jgi:hypothetical protein